MVTCPGFHTKSMGYLETFKCLVVVVVGATYLNNNDELTDSVIDLPTTRLRKMYDFIIVGGGTAGCVLANRLSHRSMRTVLLIEAGGRETVQSNVPIFHQTLRGTNLDYSYTTTEQLKACRGSHGICHWPRGKVIGGSSSINALLYVRGNPKDYDSWINGAGSEWRYEKVLPYFKLSENNKEYGHDTKFHGRDGPLPIQENTYVSPIRSSFLNASQELGYETRDINGNSQSGFMVAQSTLRNGSRVSTAKAFLHPVIRRSNLDVILNSWAEKITFVAQKATGVEFIQAGSRHAVLAGQDIIISAGVIDSPMLLMRSGIGPRDELSKLRAKPLVYLPVGKNLQDHPAVSLKFRMTKLGPEEVHAYTNRQGVLSSTGVEVVGFINSSLSNISYPDIQFHLLNPEISSVEGDNFWNLIVVVLRPKSKGSITLSQKLEPLIDPKYYDNSEDLTVMKEAIRIAFKFARTKAMKKHGSELAMEFYPLCPTTNLLSEDHISCLIEKYTITMYHPVGTCRMGPTKDSASVVDTKLKVKGTISLRVVDSSVMPKLTSGNTLAPTVMIAEKAASLILSNS